MKDRTRYSIDLSEEARDQLAATAKHYKITQGEVIEVLLDFTAHSDQIEPAYAAKREAKVMARNPKKALIDRLKGMSIEQLAALEQAVGT